MCVCVYPSFTRFLSFFPLASRYPTPGDGHTFHMNIFGLLYSHEVINDIQGTASFDHYPLRFPSTFFFLAGDDNTLHHPIINYTAFPLHHYCHKTAYGIGKVSYQQQRQKKLAKRTGLPRYPFSFVVSSPCSRLYRSATLASLPLWHPSFFAFFCSSFHFSLLLFFIPPFLFSLSPRTLPQLSSLVSFFLTPLFLLYFFVHCLAPLSNRSVLLLQSSAAFIMINPAFVCISIIAVIHHPLT